MFITVFWTSCVLPLFLVPQDFPKDVELLLSPRYGWVSTSPLSLGHSTRTGKPHPHDDVIAYPSNVVLNAHSTSGC